jgi:hypothetical protein
MSGRVGHRKRLVCVTAANLRANHLYLTGHLDFFPADCFGGSVVHRHFGRNADSGVYRRSRPSRRYSAL